MPGDDNKRVLLAANDAVSKGDIEGFLQHCTDDIDWNAIGEPSIHGKQALRQWMQGAYATPPAFTVTDLVAEDDLVVAIGAITVTNEDGSTTPGRYSDVWRFRDGKMAQLRAFVVTVDTSH